MPNTESPASSSEIIKPVRIEKVEMIFIHFDTNNKAVCDKHLDQFKKLGYEETDGYDNEDGFENVIVLSKKKTLKT